MVSELVETSKLYGRTAARIYPEWIESLCQHLVKRSYSEPHWEKKRGAVMAFEKQVLFGLPIVTQRKVNYGAIDPVVSRALFIRGALVEGQISKKYPFLQQNHSLLEEVELLEHKSRRRDLLVSDEVLEEFYAERLPGEIVSVRHFDKWWQKVRRKQPELLNFQKEMLLQKDASHVTALDYPDHWYQGELKLPLSYQFEPGKGRDGVTVHIPLPLLNQIEPAGFDWQIPGLRKELVIGWIKSLPKPQRRNLVPAPEYAGAFLGRVDKIERPLFDEMEYQFRRMTGVMIEREQWDPLAISEHLKMNFSVEDADGVPLVQGSCLYELKQQMQGQIQQALSQAVDDSLEKQGLTQWSFGDLPKSCEQKRGGFEIKAYPALVARGDSVDVKLFDSEQAQQEAMREGVRKLLLLNIPSPVKYLQQKLPNKAKLGLYFNPYGQIGTLIDDCISCGCDLLIEQQGGLVWDQQGFDALRESVRGALNDAVVGIAIEVEQILSLSNDIRKRLKGKIPLEMAFAMSDIQQQLELLIYPGFVTATGHTRLKDLNRYLRGILRRLEKLPVDPMRDRAHQLKVQAISSDYQALKNKIPPGQPVSEEISEIRWMLEELRISFFAQQLGTAYPVSEKRIRQRMEAF